MKSSITASFIGAVSALVLLASYSQAQQPSISENVMEMQDISQPPAGGVAPRPIGPRDITMADYPRESFVAGEEGKVRLRALVRSDGTVENATVEGSSGSVRLDQAASGLVRTWRYVPGMRDGIPVAARFPVIVDWKLLVLPYGMSVNEAAKFSSESYPSVSGIFRFLGAADGSIASAAVQRSSGHADLDDAALKRIRDWHLKPATLRDGSAVTVWLRTPILFGSENHSVAAPTVHSDGIIEIQDIRVPPPGIQPPQGTNSHALTREGYPVESIQRHEQGALTVKFLILEDGTVGDIELLKTSGYPRLDQAAFQQIVKWAYKPAVEANKAIPVWMHANYVFQLR